MAQFMKVQIKIVFADEETLTIDVDDNETFEEFQNRCFQLYGLNLDREYFNLDNNENVNLLQYINSLNTAEPDGHSEIIVYEIRMQSNILNTELNLPIKIEDNIPNINTEQYDSFINLNENETNVLQDNIFDNNSYILPTDSKNETIFESVNYLVNKTTEKTDVKNINDSEENKINYNFLDIESKLREIHKTTEELPNDFCRLCAKNVENFYTYGENSEFDEKLNLFLPIKISKNDNLPQRICNNCITNYNNVYNFFQNILDTNKLLRNKFIIDKNDLQLFKCRFCEEIIESAEMSVRHSTEYHCNENGLFICVLCEMGYTRLDLLKNHVDAKHKNVKNSPKIQLLHCEICNKSFPTKVRLNFHRQFHLKNPIKYFCSDCKLLFKDENMFFDHVNLFHDPEEIFVCENCESTFFLRSAYINHKKTHLEDNNFKCEVCNKVFLTKLNLVEHEVSHIETKSHKCNICEKKFTKLSKLKKHLLIHKTEPILNDVFMCNICKECFENDKMAAQHKMEHEEEVKSNCINILSIDRVFRCEFCDKCYCEIDSLNLHRLNHQDLNPYICDVCGAQFPTFSRCTTHKAIHGIFDNEDKSSFPVPKHYLCEHCNKSYLHWSYLSLHRKLKHLNNQTFKCKDCNTEFSTSMELNDHQKNIHFEESTAIKSEELVYCQICKKSFSNITSLQTHQVMRHHQKFGRNFTCQKCGKLFMSQMALDAHTKTHTKEYICSKCSKGFVQLRGLKTHLRLHDQPHTICLCCGKKCQTTKDCEIHENLHTRKKFLCQVCDKSFDTKIQLLEHNNIHDKRPYACEICGLAFRRPFTLKTHMNRHVKAKHSGSFILMVDMKDDIDNEIKPKNIQQTSTNPQNIIRNEFNAENEIPANYIDIGNGNFLQVQGNTINIDGNDYILVDQNGKEENQQFQMIVDESYNENQIPQVENLNNIMLVDNNQMIVNDTEQQFILTADNNVDKSTYIIDNQFVNDSQNF